VLQQGGEKRRNAAARHSRKAQGKRQRIDKEKGEGPFGASAIVIGA